MEEVIVNRTPLYKLRKIRPTKEESVNSVKLSSGRPTIIGRVLVDDVNTKMLSKITPLMVSRRHATFTIENGKIFVFDHSVSLFIIICLLILQLSRGVFVWSHKMHILPYLHSFSVRLAKFVCTLQTLVLHKVQKNLAKRTEKLCR